MVALTDNQLERYARHIVLKEIGGTGQQKLLASKVLVIGAGGLGSACLQYLAAAGVGTIGIVDDDEVGLSNLQRQTIHATDAIGILKVDSAAAALARINTDVNVIKHVLRLDEKSAASLIEDYDIVVDGCDNFATRFAVADACQMYKKPLVSAAVGPFEGQLATFKGYLPDMPCYRCFVPEAPARAEGSCADDGVLGALTGVMGSLQALEVIRESVGFGDSMAGRILIYDALSARMRTIKLAKDPACNSCKT